jgi:phenylacetic acid degradation operon negative regulatory protein
MKPKTEELLNLLLWSADMFLRPTFHNLTSSYESWAYRNGLFRRISRLEEQQFVERGRAWKDERLYRLTTRGRLHVLGGRDPEERWSRKWDGYWRLVLFDVPTTQNTRRTQLRRYLRNRGFGYLQNSVWITPDELQEEKLILAGGKVNVESLIFLDARPCAGKSDREVVNGAWDFTRINQRYSRHLKILTELPREALRNETAAKALLGWAATERKAWLEAVTNDPLLPEKLLPSDYLGQKSWRQRTKVLREAYRQLQTFAL